MSGIQTSNGKAFEYACVLALYNALRGSQEVNIEKNAPLETAQRFYNETSDALKSKLNKAANAAARVIIRLEPQLEYPENNIPLFLSLQTDALGIVGDVRDVLCIRNQNQWEIGLSCKHNHHAVKHSRLSSTIDFGSEWFGIPCSPEYFATVTPIFNELRAIRDNSGNTALWIDIANKNERYYITILNAFINELKRLDCTIPNTIPQRLIQYLIGKKDFYKVITDDRCHVTRVDGINLSGTLNRPSAGKRSVVNVARLKLPSLFYDISFKNKSQTTIIVTCDMGWTVSMRIHNASSRVEPSLKFDVNLISLPNTIHSQIEPW